MVLLPVYFVTVGLLSVYSYSLVDPNLTLVNSPVWTNFRNIMVEFGYNHRWESWLVYIGLIILLFVFQYFLVKRQGKLALTPVKIAAVIGTITVVSYPFLSHDFFSYIFYARIATEYHRNPYTYMAGDFYLDAWLRFTQWTGNNYPYGPVFLILSLVPSFLGMAKFAPTFFLFKLMSVLFYLIAVRYLEKLNTKWAIIFATSPLVIVEGLVNGHNDLIATALIIAGIYFFIKNKKLQSLIFSFSSIGIKYLTLPFLALYTGLKDNKRITLIAVTAGIVFVTLRTEIQPWYFIMLFGLMPFYAGLVYRLNIFFFGLMVSYFPYVRAGGWDRVIGWTTEQKVFFKHGLITVFAALNAAYLFYVYVMKPRLSQKIPVSPGRAKTKPK